MADDDDDMITEEPEGEFEEDLPEEAEPDEIDPDALEEDELEEEDDAFGTEDETFEDEDEEEDDAEAPAARRVVVPAGEDEDDDDDMITPDDVEADLDTILKDRLVTAEESEDEDEEAEPDDPRTDPGDRLQPKRPDEQLCSTCFLLVRSKAPGCPMGDDTCPIFAD